MPVFDNLKQLEVYLLKAITDSMEDVGKAVEQKTREVIEREVYQNPTDSGLAEYERTRELKNSLIHTTPKKNNNEVTTEIKHDESNFGHYAPNQHMSVVDGRELPIDALAEIVNFGKSGKIFGEGYWTKPRPYIEITKEEVEKEKLHVKAMKESLIKKGFDVK